MNRIRFLALLAAVGAAAALTGCVAPGYYYGDQGYGQPYYGEPGPVVVAPPVTVGVGVGGYWGGGGGYYDRGYYGRPAYRPGYAPGPAPHPGYGPGNAPRPGYGQGYARQGPGPAQGGPRQAPPRQPGWQTGGERVIQGPVGAEHPSGP
ncbi:MULTISPECIES: hypothetical protein [unclassified Variovorax]|uniref:hypothetical protein n=1 Tax=unclassified Variovorax TaxID=663243 RepID=UPI001BD389E5|nr:MULTISPECIES: hypothetical protein [unclassified Variovorax]